MAAIRYMINDVDRAVRFYTQHLGVKLDQQMGEEWIRPRRRLLFPFVARAAV